MSDVGTNQTETAPTAKTVKRQSSRRRGTTSTRISRRIDPSSAEYYLNRELTWLQFNRRVLNEAQDERTPLLERIKFLSIVSSNLDEFFMKRIGGLKQQVGAGVLQLTVDGRTPQQQIVECDAAVRDIESQKDALLPQLLKRLEQHGVYVETYASLDESARRELRNYYFENIFPLVTPQSMDPAHPFPFISNLSLNLLVTLRYPKGSETSLARVKVPVGAGIRRFLQIGSENRFVLLEDVMSNNLDLLFADMIVQACELFYVTRNANTTKDEGKANDLLEMIESEVRDRKFAPIVRVVVQENMDPVRSGMLAAELGLQSHGDVYQTSGMLAPRDLMEIAMLPLPDLHDLAHHPAEHCKLIESRSIFYIIRDAGSILLQHPYESFTNSVERFLETASSDPKVRAIKMTLYRTSSESKIVDTLIDAAQNGKQVAVVVELKARFDEAANIRWASRMEEAGIHVTYGVVELKTHCKVILVVRQDYSGLKRYIHMGTGNYHAGTARLYNDLGLLTCDDALGQDVTELFNYLTTGYSPKRVYKKLLPAPKLLKKAILSKIKREIEKHSEDNPGLIQFKINALEDVDITRALYEASQAGVKVDLLIRDTCRLRPGVPGLSDNIRVVGIVGRFLEHTRIFYFRNGGDEEYYIGSADMMMRNLEHRVEVLVPVEQAELREELRTILLTQLEDQRSAWDMKADGTYIQRTPISSSDRSCQETFIRLAEAREKDAERRKTRSAQQLRKRNIKR
ncbi:MAG: polyphosphate kinase 1 [Gammaproteobacteria bacterium]|nr:polyphosphate kinase 1 [Gammaproteobacteria bacterium]